MCIYNICCICVSTGISLVSHGRPRGPLAEPPRISVPWSPYVCGVISRCPSWVIHGETWNSWAQPSSIDSQVSVSHSLATSSTTSALVSCASVKVGTRLTQQKMGRKNQGHPNHLWENVIPPNPGMYFGGGLLLHFQDPWNFLEPQLHRWHHIDVWIFSWWALPLTTGSLQKLIYPLVN